MTYTYDDFLSRASGANMLGQFSQKDLEITKTNPEYGLSLLGLMQDAAGAVSDEARLIANEAINQIRTDYGTVPTGYGSFSYDKEGDYQQTVNDTLNYGSFVFGNQGTLDQKNQQAVNMAPHQYDKEGQLDSAINNATNYGPFQYEQEDAYQKALAAAVNPGTFQYDQEDAYRKALAAVVNPEAFSYEMEEDPSWSAYKKQYLREGERATADALARAAAATGGMPSSYAVSAAQQAGANYAEKLTDMIPVLIQNAYQRYLNDQGLKQTALQAISADRSDAYGKFQDAYNQLLNSYNLLSSDRSDAYGKYMDNYNMLQNTVDLLMTDKSLSQEEYDRNLNLLLTQIGLLNDQRDTAYEEHQDGYNQLLTNLGVLSDDREDSYAKWLDAYQMYLDEQLLAGSGTGTGSGSGESGQQGGAGSGTQTGTDNGNDNVGGAGDVLTDMPGIGDSGGVSAADKAWVLQNYPNGVVTSQTVWDMLVGIYGESALANAGLTFKASAGEENTLIPGDTETPGRTETPSGTGNQGQKPGGGQTVLVGDGTLTDKMWLTTPEEAAPGRESGTGNVPESGNVSTRLPSGPEMLTATGQLEGNEQIVNALLNATGTSIKGIDMDSVRALGMGDLTPQELRDLVLGGVVEEYEEDGYLRFRLKDNTATTGNGHHHLAAGAGSAGRGIEFARR